MAREYLIKYWEREGDHFKKERQYDRAIDAYGFAVQLKPSAGFFGFGGDKGRIDGKIKNCRKLSETQKKSGDGSE
jgi:hypothetical protein